MYIGGSATTCVRPQKRRRVAPTESRPPPLRTGLVVVGRARKSIVFSGELRSRAQGLNNSP